jgi:hypothetical protein
VVVPALTALFPDTALQVVGNLAPVSSAMFVDLLYEQPIFFFSPGTFNHLRVQNFLPAMEALYVCPVLEALSDALPVLWAHLLDKFP